jgi:hypothetical protein
VDARPGERTSARRHLEALASTPRPAGGEAEARARAYCADVLTGAGLAVAEEPFSYSEFPGRVATPLLGAISGVLFAVVGHIGWRNEAGLALTLLLGGASILGLAAWWAARFGVLTLPWLRARSSNLVATRGNPSYWLVAHLDSKSQPVAILVRALGVMGLLGGAVGAVVVAMLHLAGNDVRWMWPWITGIGVLSSLPVAASVVRSRSPGALDDASGVSTVLMVAQSLPPQLALGVVLTSAEELGLAGARAWVRGRGAAHAINIDGVDDKGALRLTWTRRRPASLLDLLTARAAEAGVPVRVGHLPPGALLDGVALADAGWQVVTVSRGTLGTVARIHTSRDSLDRLGGEGIAVTASIIQAVITAGA